MPFVIFVAPLLTPVAAGMIAATANLPDVRLAVISQDPLEALAAPIQAKLAAHWRVDDALNTAQLTSAASLLSDRLGPIHRLFGAAEHLQVQLAEVRARLGLPGLSVEAAWNFRNKARMKTLLRAAGLPCARHWLVSSEAEAWQVASEAGYPLVVKPPSGAGAQATFRVDRPEALSDALRANPPASDQPLLLEEFITGDEHSFETMSLDGRAVWHSLTRYYPTPLEVLANSWMQWRIVLPREVDDPPYDAIRTAAFHALEVLGMGTGLSHMEWFRRRDGTVAISEVAARPPGAQITTLMSYAHDIDVVQAWARLMVFDRFDPPVRRFATGAAYLRGQGHGRVIAIHGLEQAQHEIGPLVVEAKLPELGQVPSGGYEGEGYIILRHPETAVVEQALLRLVSLVRVELG